MKRTPAGRYVPFLIASALLLLLCIRGGTWGLIGGSAISFPRTGGEMIRIPAGQFILLHALTWAAGLGVLLTVPRGLSRRQTAWAIILLALFCRFALLPHPMSDDINRYLWEGRLVTEGINPYHYAPDDPALRHLAEDDPFHSRINHPGHPAAYPPLALMLFALAGRIAYCPAAIQWMILLFDMATLGFLLQILAHRRLSLRWAALYAFNPVVLYAFAGQGHLDALQNCFLLGAVFCYDRKRWGWMFLFAGLAVQAKYVAVLCLPFLVRRDNLYWTGMAVLAVGLPFLPFLENDPERLFHGLHSFGSRYAFNGPVHAPLRAMFGGDMAPATAHVKVLLPAALVLGYWLFHPRRSRRYGPLSPGFRDDPVSGCFFALGALLLLSPTVHFWYLTWIIPFLAIRPFASWTVLCLTISFYFVTVGNLHATGRWHLPAWAFAAQWLPFGLLFAGDVYRFVRQIASAAPVPETAPETVSVVIPVRDEADRIADCVSAVRDDPAVHEVIVVDGGSTDATVLLARNAGAQVLHHRAPPEKGGGRGGQIHAGVKAATGDIVAVVHADTLVTRPAFTRIRELLARQEMIVGGAVGGSFSGTGWRLRLLELANDFRAAFFGISFGDQVQFFRRRAVMETGQLPDTPLMEDVELSLRLSRLGRTVFLFGDAVVSARRWRTNVSGRTLLVLRLFTAYLWQRFRGTVDTAAMYRRYYGE